MLGKYADLAKLLVYAAAACFFFWIGGVVKDRKCLEARQADAVQAAKLTEAERQRADKINERLQAELAKPKHGPSVREVVRENPSGCAVPKPVADRLRQAVRDSECAATGRCGPVPSAK